MRVELLTDIEDFEKLATEWDDLLARSVAPSLFLTFAWQRTWWQHLGDGELMLLTVRAEADRLVGLAPFFRETTSQGEQRISLIGCVDVSDYLDLIVDRTCADEVYHSLWSFISGFNAPEWDEIRLCNLSHISPTHDRWRDLAESSGHAATVTVEDVCPVISLPSTWDEYLASLDKKQRHEIRRKIRRAREAADVELKVIEQGDTLSQDMEDFILLHQKSTEEKEGFWNDQMITFFREITKKIAEMGDLKLYFVEMDGIRAATLLCFDYQNEILVYNSGYDPEQFAHLSPGIILVAFCIEHAIQLGRSRFDFLRGDEVYKFRFGAEPEPVSRLHILKKP
jgi:CelD/BcsL family acetyltransferase involved in cellulose biosynthesis